MTTKTSIQDKAWIARYSGWSIDDLLLAAAEQARAAERVRRWHARTERSGNRFAFPFDCTPCHDTGVLVADSYNGIYIRLCDVSGCRSARSLQIAMVARDPAFDAARADPVHRTAGINYEPDQFGILPNPPRLDPSRPEIRVQIDGLSRFVAERRRVSSIAQEIYEAISLEGRTPDEQLALIEQFFSAAVGPETWAEFSFGGLDEISGRLITVDAIASLIVQINQRFARETPPDGTKPVP